MDEQKQLGLRLRAAREAAGMSQSDEVALIPDLAKYLEWAVDLLDMYDKRMVELGDPPDKVYSQTHVEAKARARALIKAGMSQ